MMSEDVFASFAIRIRPPRQGEVRLAGREAQILLLLLLPLPLLLFLPLPTVAAAAAAAALPVATPAAATAASTASTATIVAAPAAPASLTALCVQLMLLPAASVHAVVAASSAATAAHCATLHAGGHGGCVLWVLEVVLHMLEAVEGVRSSGSYALLYARGRRRCALYAEVARLAKRFLPDGSDSRPSLGPLHRGEFRGF